jgi:hypothetical protein
VVGKHQSAFEKIDLAPELHLVDGQQVPGQHEQRQRVRRKQSLVAHVVDGEHGGGGPEDGIAGVAGAQQHGNQRRLPVVTMKHLGHAQDFGRFQHGAGVEREALGVVRIITGRRSVERVAVEERRIIDKVELHAGVVPAVEHGAKAILVVKRDRYAGQQHLGVIDLGLFIFREIS